MNFTSDASREINYNKQVKLKERAEPRLWEEVLQRDGGAENPNTQHRSKTPATGFLSPTTFLI